MEAARNGIGRSHSGDHMVRALQTQRSVISGLSPLVALFFDLVKRKHLITNPFIFISIWTGSVKKESR